MLFWKLYVLRENRLNSGEIIVFFDIFFHGNSSIAHFYSNRRKIKKVGLKQENGS